MKIRFIFAWYDLWVGIYWDRKHRRLYLMIPMIGFYVEFAKKIINKRTCTNCYYYNTSVSNCRNCCTDNHWKPIQ